MNVFILLSEQSKLIEIIKIIFVKFSRNIFLKNVLYKKFRGEAELPSWTRSWVKMERIYNCAHAKSKRNRLIVHVK